MPTRSATQTALDILHALLARRTVVQSELAKELHLRSDTLGKHLHALLASGVPLVREADGRQVYWSVPKSWVPEGVLVGHEDSYELIKLLAQLPRSRRRDALLSRLGAAMLDGRALRERAEHAFAQPELDTRFLPLVEDAILRRVTLRVRYYTMSRGVLEWRHLSALRLVPPLRMIARCHRDRALKWFRVDNITEAALAPEVAYDPATPDEVDAYERASVNGFNANEALSELSFTVRAPEDRWVRRNLPRADARSEPVAGGLRVTITSAAPVSVARFVLSLGGAARAESPRLRVLVASLAADALAAHRD